MDIIVKTSIGEFTALHSFVIAKGQKFSLHPISTEELKWFTDNDPVLALVKKGLFATVEALSVGVSIVEIRSESPEETTVLTIEVKEFIEATVLEGTITQVEPLGT